MNSKSNCQTYAWSPRFSVSSYLGRHEKVNIQIRMAVLMEKKKSAQCRVLILHNYMAFYIRGCGYATLPNFAAPKHPGLPL